jgi:hypothetical protein
MSATAVVFVPAHRWVVGGEARTETVIAFWLASIMLPTKCSHPSRGTTMIKSVPLVDDVSRDHVTLS